MCIKPGMLVDTPHGTGTVLRFEHIEHVSLPITYTDTYTERDRIEVQLHDPSHWFPDVGNPHYVLRELRLQHEHLPNPS